MDLEAFRNCVDEIEAEIVVVLRPRKKVPSVLLVLGICVVVVFYKIGEYDQEIGTTVGLIVGALVLAANVYLPGGLLRLGLYIVAGLALLTVYKILRSALAARSSDEDTNDD